MNLGESMLTYRTEAREVHSLLGAGARHLRAILILPLLRRDVWLRPGVFYCTKKSPLTTERRPLCAYHGQIHYCTIVLLIDAS